MAASLVTYYFPAKRGEITSKKLHGKSKAFTNATQHVKLKWEFTLCPSCLLT